MSLAISEEHEALRATSRRWLDAHCPPDVPRALLDAEDEELQPVWKEFAAQGWLGLHIPERWGGQGYGLFELAVVLEQSGRCLFPGPLLPTVTLSAALAEAGTDDQAADLLPGLVDGSVAGAIYIGSSHLDIVGRGDDGSLVVSGALRPVLGASTASLVLVPARAGDDPAVWCLLDVGTGGGAAQVGPLESLDPTRRVGTVVAESVTIAAQRQLRSLTGERVHELMIALGAAELTGGARWCLETAAEYAKVREQFGRPIGQFQAVKHRLADMLVRTEQITAVAWDAALAAASGPSDETALAVGTAGALVFDGCVDNAKDCVQLLGGIGFTWDHDAHLHLRRAVAARQLLGGPEGYLTEVVGLALRGVRRVLTTDLPEEADRVRSTLAPVLESLGESEGQDRRRALVDAGLVVPHWPTPWGRDSSAVEQLVIDADLAEAGVVRPHLGVGAWALPVIIAHGSEEQRRRWVRPTLLGELKWCQLFSEPGAGSDLASLTTRAERTDGGWLLNGQKVWTSMALESDWGICLARTDPTVPKHEGITYFIVDMRSPGLDIRPLRELTGDAMFNEVFIDDLFVPDDCVIGGEGQGWKMARATLANERVSMSSGSTFGIGVESLLHLTQRQAEPVSAGTMLKLASLLVEAQSLGLVAHRSMLRTLAGTDPGPGTSVRKLLGAEHEQRVQEMGLAMFGPEGAALDGYAKRWAHGFLVTRCLTIAGGTSEIQRNVIAERLLGLPRDPEPGM
ncbi:MAG TPA: acyl-CoA dehydrogenase [Acidimicrobiales bacterium]|jgi:alkylation response protein AidB-like acyl-CoA dehydrogenase|nr:acyl-CoA dehydrogenase [Acidimicrobiales bacterium]